MKVFLAAPSADNESINVDLAKKILEKKGFDVYSSSEVNTENDFDIIDEYIDDCNIIVALYYGAISDANVAYTCGYAYAKDKFIVIVNMSNDPTDSMVSYCYDIKLQGLAGLLDYDFNDNCPGSDFY